MYFSVRKNIIQKKQSSFKDSINLFILLLAIPVIIIAGISVSIYFSFLWLKDKIIKEKIPEPAQDHYHFEIDLIHNEHLHITLIEDELDIELTQLNEAWQEEVYNDETFLYRAHTVPLIPALNGSICCFYCKEIFDGLLLQILPVDKNTGGLNTQLVFINYKNFEIKVIDATGAFFLYNDDKNARIIRGLNKKEKITIELMPEE